MIHPSPPSLVTPGCGGGHGGAVTEVNKSSESETESEKEEGSLTVCPWLLVNAPQAWFLLPCLRSGREPRKPVEEYLAGRRGRGRGALT